MATLKRAICDKKWLAMLPFLPFVALTETTNGPFMSCLLSCDLRIWHMTLKNNRAPLLCHFKLYASFHSHRWIQAEVKVKKRPIWVKINDFLCRVTLQFDVWPWKTTGHLSYAVSSFVQHFIAIGEFKLELQSGNAQSGSNSMIFRPCDLEIWCMTLKNNRAPLSSSMHHFVAIGESKMELQSGNTQFGSNPTLFLAVWPWNLTYDLEKL